jgi:hypothetical protein
VKTPNETLRSLPTSSVINLLNVIELRMLRQVLLKLTPRRSVLVATRTSASQNGSEKTKTDDEKPRVHDKKVTQFSANVPETAVKLLLLDDGVTVKDLRINLFLFRGFTEALIGWRASLPSIPIQSGNKGDPITAR